ncbi:unnamed protein product [Heligmosomoides polygyrus]|uniref:P/Homo B domain-containing protein n=1 Tax=Heligmosomoides polygyrus TaxID=6339 RepID=A0A3P7Y654_HELPZ|nr:unnamed protein product [Heligmosomoides polygyrus]
MSQLFVPLLVCLIAPSFAVPLSEIVESLLTANQPVNSYWQPKADGADRFAVEINAPDWNQVQSIAHAAGFVVEGRVQWAEHLVPFYREKRTLSFSDPLYEHQLRSDDGVEEGHDDLQAALDKEISHNFVSAKDRSIEERSDQIDIYSVSWGPKDDGRSAERPGSLAQKALEFGAAHGRKGLGSLYVWASGNGGLEEDDCAMDGYASNMHTLTFGVASSSGIPPWYAEGCSAVIAAISEGSPTENGMVTTDIGNKCASFAGSSAAAPFGAAILALTLEANPSLTQRDVQHLIVHTSDSEHLRISSPSYWLVNGAGLPFSRHFGFGVLNALRLTRAARSWKTVPALTTCSRQLTVLNGQGCSGTSGEVNWIERLQLEVSIEHPQRGLISLLLTSPAGELVAALVSHPSASKLFELKYFQLSNG